MKPIKLKQGQHTRQGDVLVIRVSEIPENLPKCERDKLGRFVVAESEATGHAHVVAAKEAVMVGPEFRDSNAGPVMVFYCESPVPFSLDHMMGLRPTGEHDSHQFAPGKYAMTYQYQYSDAGEWEQVRD